MTKGLVNSLLIGGLAGIWFYIWSDVSELSGEKKVPAVTFRSPDLKKESIRLDSLLEINPFQVPHLKRKKTVVTSVTPLTKSIPQSSFSAVLLGRTQSEGKELFILSLPDGSVFHVGIGDTVSGYKLWKSVGDTVLMKSLKSKTVVKVGM